MRFTFGKPGLAPGCTAVGTEHVRTGDLRRPEGERDAGAVAAARLTAEKILQQPSGSPSRSSRRLNRHFNFYCRVGGNWEEKLGKGSVHLSARRALGVVAEFRNGET